MPKITKGSQEMKDKMAHLRSLRKLKGGKITIQEPSAIIVGGGTSKNSWINHVKSYCKSHNNMPYFTALKQADIKEGYKK